MRRTVRIPIKVTVKQPTITVTKSGRLYCNNCGRLNQVSAGLKNPICGNCGWRLA